jgi:hypothetical protein
MYSALAIKVPKLIACISIEYLDSPRKTSLDEILVLQLTQRPQIKKYSCLFLHIKKVLLKLPGNFTQNEIASTHIKDFKKYKIMGFNS